MTRYDSTDEYYGTLTIKDLEDLVDEGSTKEKRAARTELKEREAQILLEKEEVHSLILAFDTKGSLRRRY